jgi:two-component system, OmpR family, sensor histidine kinase MprB
MSSTRRPIAGGVVPRAIELDLDVEPTVVLHSPDLVTRAVANLIDNARAWGADGETIKITLRDGLLTVRDHGPGFAADDVERVFDRFYRSDWARRLPGSGLGLAIVKQAAEAHGGFAAADNAPDGGAILRVSFGPTVPSTPDVASAGRP